MKKIFIAILVVISLRVYAQNIQQEINEQVWKPFIVSFNNRDTESFMAIHSKDVVRSPRDSKRVLNWEEYFQTQQRGDKSEIASKTKRTLELRFTERLASNNQAVEVGVYKTTYTDTAGASKSFCGRFHVVLRKENGNWRILVDTDSSEGGTISEKDFLAAAPMEP